MDAIPGGFDPDEKVIPRNYRWGGVYLQFNCRNPY